MYTERVSIIDLNLYYNYKNIQKLQNVKNFVSALKIILKFKFDMQHLMHCDEGGPEMCCKIVVWFLFNCDC
jgi:hypothetical protein